MPAAGHKNVSQRQAEASQWQAFQGDLRTGRQATHARVGARAQPGQPAGQKSPQRFAAGTAERAGGLGSVIADGLDRAAFFGFLAAGFFFGRLGLLEKVRVTAVLVTLEIVGCRLAAQVAINALVIDVILARNVFRIFVCSVSHKITYFSLAIWRAPAAMASSFNLFHRGRGGRFILKEGGNPMKKPELRGITCNL
jgi:hypothetical protein